MNVPAKCNAKYVALCILPNEIITVNILLNRCGAYTDAGLKISTDLIFPRSIKISKEQVLSERGLVVVRIET